MASLIQLNNAINNVLLSSFPEIKIQSSEVQEGFGRPSFFTKVIPVNMEYETTNFKSVKIMVVINYFGKDRTELSNLKMHDEIQKAFGKTLKVNQRSFLLKNIRSDIVDGALQFKFDLDYFVDIERSDDYEVMQNLETKITKE